MLKRFMLLFLSVLLCLYACACDGDGNNINSDDDRLTIVTTLFPQYDFAKAIVGDKADVHLLLTPGTDSHSFELTPSDISMIKSCDIFIYTGPNMEIWVNGILDVINGDTRIVNLTESEGLVLKCAHEHHADDEHGDYDPHIWTSPVNAMCLLLNIFDAVCAEDQDNAEYYRGNYLAYRDELLSLDTSLRSIADASAHNTLYFTGKFAFLYLVEEYGFDYVAPFNSCSDLQVEDLASVAKLVKEINDKNISYVFYEEFSSSDILNTVINSTGATPLLLHSAHNLSKDELDSGATYISIMKANIENIRKGSFRWKN